jgi:hypothetical protein
MPTHAVSQLSLAPLGAGDLIDRTIRLYRRHFATLIRACVPPVVTLTAGGVLWTVGSRAAWATESVGRFWAYVGMAALGVGVILLGYLFLLVVMGGASRNLVMHLLSDEPVSARAIYRNVRLRFWRLLVATALIGVWAAACFFFTVFILYMVIGVTALVGILVGSAGWLGAWIAGAVGVVITLAALTLALLFFFFLVGRVAYVPQVLLVEGRGVWESISRSVELARGNVRRLAALFVFTTFAAQSALMLLVIPLGWVGWVNGVNPVPFGDEWPTWYAIGYEVIAQLSTILLTPVWMLGLSLLYVDERVRHEGYDIELQAARVLGDIPEITQPMPLTPAVARAPVEEARPVGAHEGFGGSVLGLGDRR